MNTKCPSRDFIYQDWILSETKFNPEQSHSRGTVFTIGNGYLGTRGSLEEGHARGLPATFIHGVYDDVPVVYTELANCPDWLPMIIAINGDRFRMDQGKYYTTNVNLMLVKVCSVVLCVGVVPVVASSISTLNALLVWQITIY